MAQLKKMIPFLIFWESGVKTYGASNEQLFLTAKSKGIVRDPVDRGGATLVGITIGTYKDYCRKKGQPTPAVSSLNSLSYAEWLDILKTMFWNRWQADLIADQKVAEMLVDWVWTSGSYGISIPQRLLGVKADGIVGPKTLDAVNKYDSAELLEKIRLERIAYIDRICRLRPQNSKYRKGWLSRIEAIAAQRQIT